ncbi:MAG: conjugal transfer protein TrbJ [Gammaproteobacteria bacterium]
MKNKNFKKLHIHIIFTILLFINHSFVNILYASGQPVHDYLTYSELLLQGAEQGLQYSTQLEEYALQIKNAKSLLEGQYIWSDAEKTINDLLNTIDTISEIPGGLDQHLNQFQDIEHYQSSPCFSTSGCTDSERAALQENKVAGSSAQKEANDAMINGLALQQTHIEDEAKKLQSLQANATSAEGQMAAIQYANQLASSQTHQLMQIRGLLIAEQMASASRAQVIADREAQQAAAAKQLRAGTYQDSSGRNWLGVTP